MKNRTSLGYIDSLKPNEVFVFGSNLAGIHGAGGAKMALNFGARMGVGIGMMGYTYAIPTKDKTAQYSLPINTIQLYVNQFIQFAIVHQHYTFLVTEIGCLRAGYTPEQIAPLFKDAVDVENIHLPKRFWDVLLGKQETF